MGLIVSLAYEPAARRRTCRSRSPRWAARRWTSSRTTSASALLAEPDVDEVEHRGRVGPGVDQGPHPRRRARDDAPAGDRGMSRARETVWEVFARKAYEEPLHHVGTVTEDDEDLALVSRPRDLRRAAVDRDDHRPAHRDPGGDPGMSGDAAGPPADAATATMVSLIGSLADNKAALGRRYGEWAVSAPTIESAVAAAAMAQDELGHARSTYPVLGKLGVERDDEGLDARPRARRCSTTSCPTGRRSSPPTCVVDGDPDHVRRRRPRQLDRAAGPARAQDPPGGGRPPRPRRGLGAAALPRRRRRPRAAAAGASSETWDAGRALARARRRSRLPRRRSTERHGHATGPAAIRERVRELAARAARCRRCAVDARRAGRLVGAGTSAAPVTVTPLDLPVLRLARRSSSCRPGAGR